MSWSSLRDLPLRRFTVDEVGPVLGANSALGHDGLELVDGYIVAAPEPTARAAYVRHELARRLETSGIGAWVGQRRTIAVGPYDRPDTDILVARSPHAAFADRHPTGADLILVVEIADGNQAFKRTKAAAYATAGVPEYWIVDLPNRRVEQHRGPHGRGWLDVQLLDDRDTIDVPGETIPWKVADLVA